jgi:hypothetical protein
VYAPSRWESAKEVIPWAKGLFVATLQAEEAELKIASRCQSVRLLSMHGNAVSG